MPAQRLTNAFTALYRRPLQESEVNSWKGSLGAGALHSESRADSRQPDNELLNSASVSVAFLEPSGPQPRRV